MAEKLKKNKTYNVSVCKLAFTNNWHNKKKKKLRPHYKKWTQKMCLNRVHTLFYKTSSRLFHEMRPIFREISVFGDVFPERSLKLKCFSRLLYNDNALRATYLTSFCWNLIFLTLIKQYNWHTMLTTWWTES